MWYTIYFPIGQLSFDLYQLCVLVLVLVKGPMFV